ncbi:hypothetical protein BDZ94DRAFT_1056764 [Collybia nuda]|uniref:Uncharacterized protein n=1 Tax=Collybia nuda TaxID=64659 RepID=A0A9P5Y0N9_9AGAR|nr:hypothetical protein BDZ94DRAFT_1056764 [Collybia nuda]
MSTPTPLQPLVEMHNSNQPVDPSPVDPNSPMDLPVPNWITPKRTYWEEHFSDDIKEADAKSRMVCGLWIIRRASGFRRIALKSGRPNDRAIAEDTFVMNAEPEIIVPILSMCSTLERSYYKRPTKEQFDRLVQIIGKEPEWWIQHKTGDTF